MFSKYDPPVPPPLPWLGRLRPLGPLFWGPFLGMARQRFRSWCDPVRVLLLGEQLIAFLRTLSSEPGPTHARRAGPDGPRGPDTGESAT